MLVEVHVDGVADGRGRRPCAGRRTGSGTASRPLASCGVQLGRARGEALQAVLEAERPRRRASPHRTRRGSRRSRSWAAPATTLREAASRGSPSRRGARRAPDGRLLDAVGRARAWRSGERPRPGGHLVGARRQTVEVVGGPLDAVVGGADEAVDACRAGLDDRELRIVETGGAAARRGGRARWSVRSPLSVVETPATVLPDAGDPLVAGRHLLGTVGQPSVWAGSAAVRARGCRDRWPSRVAPACEPLGPRQRGGRAVVRAARAPARARAGRRRGTALRWRRRRRRPRPCRRPAAAGSRPSTALPRSSWTWLKPIRSRSAAVWLTSEATEALTCLMTVLPMIVVM